VLERAAILGDGKRLEVAAALGVGVGHGVPVTAGGAAEAAPAGADQGLATLADLERRHIEETLAQTGGRVEGRFGAARILGLNPNTLRGRMRKLDIDARRFRPRPGDR